MARDIYHYEVKEALIKDGWTITNDPLVLLGKNEGGLQTDLGAEKIITAEKGLTKIAVEVKVLSIHLSFMSFWKLLGNTVVITLP